jgi:hypothetical protein
MHDRLTGNVSRSTYVAFILVKAPVSHKRKNILRFEEVELSWTGAIFTYTPRFVLSFKQEKEEFWN